MLKLEISPTAHRDMDVAWDYIAHDNPVAANEWFDKLLKEFNRLQNYPQIGRSKLEFKSNLRSWPFGSYLIFYRVSAKTLTIMRVMSGYRDISESEFGEL